MLGFTALGDPTRRRIVEMLAARELAAGEIAERFDMTAPAVSQHLKLLREAGLVHVRRDGRHMPYQTNAEAIRPLHEWTKTFERLWQHQLQRIKVRAEAKLKQN